MATLSLDITISGSVVNSVVLSDSTGTFGVKRTRDNAIIIPPGTVVPKTGVSSYALETGLLDDSESYTAVFKVTYALVSQPGNIFTEYITTSILASLSTRSLKYLRRILAHRLGGFELISQPTASPANDQVRVESLIQESDDPNAYDGTWIYVAQGQYQGVQRRVKAGGYDRNAGTITVVSPFGTNPLEANTVVEVHTRLPAIRQNRLPGLRDIINDALSGMWTIQRIPFVGDGTEFFLMGQEWLTHQSQIVDVYAPSSTGYRPYQVGAGYSFSYNAESPRLEGSALSASESGWEMEVVRPANTWIKHGGAWADSASGLQDDEDECLLPPQAVIPVALWYAYEALSVAPWESDATRQEWRALSRDWAPVAARVKANYMPEVDPSPGAHGRSRAPVFGYKGLLGW